MTVTAERPARRGSLAQQNAAKIQRLMINQGTGGADLHRTVAAGPSGQRADRKIARVVYDWTGNFELKILSVSPDSFGDVAGYARRLDLFEMAKRPGCEWVIHEYDDYEGCRLLGYASSLVLGCDVLMNGVHVATGRHDSRRISGGTWKPNPNE